MITRTIIAALLAASAAGSAGALTISYGQDITTPRQPDWNAYLSWRQFDPSLGTLTAVNFEIRGQVTGYQYVENRQSYGISVDVGDQAYVNLTAPGAAAYGAWPLWHGGIQRLTPFDGTLDFAGSSGGYGSGSASATSGGYSFDLDAYIGTGFVDGVRLDVSSFAAQGYDIDDYFAQYTFDEVTGGASVIYTYDAPVVVPPAGGVPEPASWAMLIAGFGLVGAGQRRRRGIPRVAA